MFGEGKKSASEEEKEKEKRGKLVTFRFPKQYLRKKREKRTRPTWYSAEAERQERGILQEKGGR